MTMTGSVEIRLAIASDAEALAVLAARTFAETFGDDNRPEDLQQHLMSAYGIAQQLAEIQDAEVCSLLAYRTGELIGFAQVRRKAVPSCVTAAEPVELHRFYLTRPAQGTGAAAALMAAVRQAARTLGGGQLWLGVWERNPRAMAFYAKSGFVRVGSHEFLVGEDRQTDWILVTELDVE